LTGGAYDDDFKIDIFGYSGTILYLLSFYLMCVVMLNLLIAIISDKFDNVYEQSLSSDYKEKCQLLIEFEDMKLIFSSPIKLLKNLECIKKGKDNNQELESKDEEKVEFLHLIRYEKDSREEDNFSEGQE
jgi:hypothetical protein